MITDLTSLKWKKDIYYISEDVIFEIVGKRKSPDLDECSSYLIDLNKLPEKMKKASDGSFLDIKTYTEAYIENVPYIQLYFTGVTNDSILIKTFPLQYLIEEGDMVIEGKTKQKHPDIYNNSYLNKFNSDVFNYIKNIVKNKPLYDSANVKAVLKVLPEWLLNGSDNQMNETYIDKFFVKGTRYNKTLATKGDADLYIFNRAILGVGTAEEDEFAPINIWNEEIIEKALEAIYAEKTLNKYNESIKALTELNIAPSYMELMAQSLKTYDIKDSNKDIKTFINVKYDNHSVSKLNFESVSVNPEIDSYYEYVNDTCNSFDYIHDEASWNESFANGGLKKYYEWSDRVNKPYKEDLWNTVANRPANINDAKKDPETGEYILDENGNYIYENCERCWLGAVKAPGAKYPWIALNFDTNINSKVNFKYEYEDETKTVSPWGTKVFGINSFGCASVASEFGDNDFLLPENRTDGRQSTFDITKFKVELIPE